MKQSDGFDHIRAYQERMKRQEQDDSFEVKFFLALVSIALSATIIYKLFQWATNA
jgi:hypothetical protein